MSVSETMEGRGGKGPVPTAHAAALSEPVCLVLPAVAVVSCFGLALMSWDKRQAGRRARRVRERTLLMTAILGGAWGVWLGMSLVRHKTRKPRFRVVVPLAALVWLALAVWTTLLCRGLV